MGSAFICGEGNGTPLQYSCLENPMDWDWRLGRLQSMGLLRVRHDWATSLSLFTFMHWRRKWQSTPVFLPGESQGWGRLLGCHLWGLHRVGHDWNDLAAAAAFIWENSWKWCISWQKTGARVPRVFRLPEGEIHFMLQILACYIHLVYLCLWDMKSYPLVFQESVLFHLGDTWHQSQDRGSSLVVRSLGPHLPMQGCVGSIIGCGARIPLASVPKKPKQKAEAVL